MSKLKKKYEELLSQMKTSSSDSSSSSSTSSTTNKILSGEYQKEYEKNNENHQQKMQEQEAKKQQQEAEQKQKRQQQKAEQQERTTKLKEKLSSLRPTNTGETTNASDEKIKVSSFAENLLNGNNVRNTNNQTKSTSLLGNKTISGNVTKERLDTKVDADTSNEEKQWKKNQEKNADLIGDIDSKAPIAAWGENLIKGVGKGGLNIGRSVGRIANDVAGEDSPLISILSEAVDVVDKSGNLSSKIKQFGEDETSGYQKLDADMSKSKQELEEQMNANTESQSNAVSKKIAEVLPSIGQMVPSMLANLIPGIGNAASVATATATASDDYYDDAKSRGMDESSAQTYAGVMGVVEGLTEGIQIGKIASLGKNIAGVGAKDVTATTVKSALKDFGINVADNFAQEAITEPISEGAAYVIGGKDTADFSNMSDRMLQSGIDGAISAVITSGASAGIGSAVNINTKLQNGEQVTQEEIKQAVQDIQTSGKVDVEKVVKDEISSQVNSQITNTQNQKIQQSQDNINQLDSQIEQQQAYSDYNDYKEQEIAEATLNQMYQEKDAEQKKLQEQLQQKLETSQKNSYQYEASENEKINNLRQDASKYLDNSIETSNLMSTMEKVIEDKNYNIRLDDTIKAPNGNSVNAQIQTLPNGETEIKINPNSNRAAEILLTHEITHSIETESMKNLVMDYASKNKEFAGALQNLKEEYGTNDVSDEVLADVSGQLLGNQEFIDNLLMDKPKLFRRIYNKIISIANKLTGNKIENLFIKNLKNKWQEAYRNSSKRITDTKFSKDINSAFKNKQFDIVSKNNAMTDDYHVGIRDASDIMTWEEAIKDDESFFYGDFDIEDAQKALESGKITVYSSKPIKDGGFVSTSKNMARDYAGSGKIYSQEVNINDVAWINGDEGQYAKVDDTRYSKENSEWQDFLESNFKGRGTTTNFKTISKDTQQVIQDNIQKQLKDIVTPMQETIQKLSEQIDSLTQENAPLASGLTEEEQNEKKIYDDFISDNSYDKLDKASKERYDYLRSQVQEETQNVLEDNLDVKGIESSRNIDDVGNRSVKAYQYENPEVKPYFKTEAKNMLVDLRESLPASRYKVGDEWTGNARSTTDAIAELKDKYGYTYDQIEKGLKAIVNDNGAENNAVSKRIEFMLDRQMREGYTDVQGYQVPPNQDYINYLQSKDIEGNSNNYDSMSDEEIEYEVAQQNASYDTRINNTANIINDALSTAKYSLNTDIEEEDYTPVTSNKKVQSKMENGDDTLQSTIDKISVKRTKEKTSLTKMKDDLAQSMVNKAHYLDKLAKETNTPSLKYAYDRMLGSFGEGQYCIGKEQVNSKGEVTGKSIIDIFKPAQKADLYKEFNDYLLNKHNIDRQVVDKAVYGKEFTAENSKRIIRDYDKKYPEMKKWAKDVYRFNKNNLQELQDEGFISKKTHDSLLSMYGHYVPTFRDIVDTLTDEDNSVSFDFTGNDTEKNKKIGGNSPLKKATGGSQNILAVDEAMAENIVMQKRAIRMNQTLKELYNSLSKSDKNEVTQIPVPDGDMTAVSLLTSSPENFIQKQDNGKYTALFYENGNIKSFTISEDMYKAFEPSQIEELINKNAFTQKTFGVLKKITDFRRNLLTTYSIGFSMSNPIKDVQEAVFNTKYSVGKFATNYTRALWEMATNGKYYNDYMKQGRRS